MQIAPPPIPIVRGEGARLYTADGRTLLDGISSWWVNTYGHGRPEIARAIADQAQQLEQVIYAGFSHEPAARLASRLVAVLPGEQSRIFYSDNGSTAVEVGLKMAIQYHWNQGADRRRILAFDTGFHGETFGAMSVGGDLALFDAFDDYLFKVDRLPTPRPGREEAALAALDRELARGGVAAFIFEPVLQGAGGMVTYAPEVLSEMIARCRAAGVICIADEVMTGFGRTGRNFASEYLSEQPDIFCLAKGLTGGFLPLSVTSCTERIYQAFLSEDKSKTLFHGHSFTANPLGCAAALAGIDILESAECQADIQRIARAQTAFAESLSGHPRVRAVRQLGTMVAVEFAASEDTSYFNSLRDRLYDFFLERDLLLRPLGNIVYILPPYCTTDAELQTLQAAIEEALERIT
jgi:adenosylmethionine-8-amino-7-oxononanoate aminotransferase